MTDKPIALITGGAQGIGFASAEALALRHPAFDVLRPTAGHVGMVVSAGAKKRVWQPLAAWLHARFA